jgi:hypothetical protein
MSAMVERMEQLSLEAEHIRISDYSDRELLGVMFDLAGTGVVTSRELATRLFAIPEGEDFAELTKHATKCAGTRLSWMKRYGLVESGDKLGEWQISVAGDQLRRAKLRGAVSSGIAQTDAALDLANAVGEKLVKAGKVEGRAMQRELTFQINRRKHQPWYT